MSGKEKCRNLSDTSQRTMYMGWGQLHSYTATGSGNNCKITREDTDTITDLIEEIMGLKHNKN